MDSFFFTTSVVAAIGLFFLISVAAAIGFFTLLRKYRFHQESKENNSSSPPSFPSLSCPQSPSSSLSLSPPQYSLSRNWDHNVFPSFHGPDVREGFLSHVLKEFRNKGIELFIDNNIERSKSIGPELERAIRGSKIAIVLLSKNYASSSWCLDELVEIMKCRALGQTVMTIFYKVDPTDVKKQTGDFGKAFGKTCKGKSKKKIETWRKALEDVATIAGYHSKNCVNEAALIEEISVNVSKMLNQLIPSRDFERFIGMGTHIEKMKPLLSMDSDEVGMIGIWGPPGIGKTTIARFLFNQLSNSFQLSTIMANVKGSYPRPCLDEGSAQLQLQNQMLSQMLNHKDMVITHLEVAQERLKDKKVFLVLDDVDEVAQLEALAKNTRWFGPGSRIIITTQDLRVLRAHGINDVYTVDLPSGDEALQIFCMSAFGQKYPKNGFRELSWEIVCHAGKLPLGLKVMGSYFRNMSKQDWKKALPKLWSSLDGKIESILKFSYDALDYDDKYLFRHIACLFVNEKTERVKEYLAKTFPYVSHGLDVLALKSLISLKDKRFAAAKSLIYMHSLLVTLGREIVRKQSENPGQREFLVDSGEISEILEDDGAGSGNIIGINFDAYGLSGGLNISERAFEGMSNLQFLKIKGETLHLPRGLSYLSPIKGETLHLPHGLSYLSPRLRLLDWDHFPATCLPSNVNLKFLVELNMRESKLEKLWEGIKHLPNLKWMDLNCSRNLKELPDLSTTTNLEILNLFGCSSLMELPSSIGNATNLQILDLSECSSLVELPSSIGNATNLQELDLRQCSSLVELPSSIGNATNLQKLNLKQCSSLVMLPSSIGNATNLQKFYLSECSSLMELPSSIGNATNLQILDLSECSSLVELPSSIGNATNLQELDLRQCSSLVELPSSIGNATNLQKLYLSECSSLVELPSSIGNATNLQELDLRQCSSLVELPSSIGNATNLQKLYLSECSSLVELPSSIGNATNLQILYLSECSSLVELPSSIGNATNLQELDLRQCSSLVELPSSIGNATDLRILDLIGCSSLVELPSSIGDLHELRSLYLIGCSKLEVLPVNVNLKSLYFLDLSDCSSLKCFPDICTNISYLDLSGTAIEEVPSSIRTWSRLDDLYMSYSEKLEEFPHALDTITVLYLTDSEIEELRPWVKGISHLRGLILKGCKELLSLPQLPDSLLELDVRNCESLERLDCSFQNPKITLKFVNCFKLNQEAKDLIIQTSPREVNVLPGKEISTYFTYRANGGSLIVKLKERPFSSSLKFKACILLNKKNGFEGEAFPFYMIEVKQNSVMCSPGYRSLPHPLTEGHLYIFEFEVDVTSNELSFEFSIGGSGSYSDKWVIKDCGCIPE